MKSLLRRLTLALLIAPAVVLLTAAAADAHVSVHPNTIPAEAFATVNVRVPGEQSGAHVTRVDTLLPPGFVSVAYENVPGWRTQVTYQKLATPVQSDSGPIDTEVSQIIWTWQGPLGRVDNNQFIQFPLSLAIPASDTGRSLAFKTVQTYSNGQIVHWIGPPSTDTPSPTINVTRPSGVIEDVTGGEAGPPPGDVPSSASAPPGQTQPRSGASTGLAVVALIVGAAGLLAGLAALGALRRGRPTG
jgi:uncharacterized protein YcnI